MLARPSPPLNTSQMHVLQLLFGRFQQSANLLAKLGIVGVTVFDNSVTDRGVKYLFFRAFDPQSTAALARMVAAIDCFSICHGAFPLFTLEFKL